MEGKWMDNLLDEGCSGNSGEGNEVPPRVTFTRSHKVRVCAYWKRFRRTSTDFFILLESNIRGRPKAFAYVLQEKNAYDSQLVNIPPLTG
jgi:hypothetical protein